MALTTVSPGLLDSTAQYYSFKNRIINGAMVIDQRNAGAAVTINGTFVYTIDRWGVAAIGGGAFSVQRVSDAPSGFINSLSVTVSTADSSIGTGDNYQLLQSIEGFNTSDFAWGTASASPVTLSFWVKSSITGTHSGALLNESPNRSYVFTFSVIAANTWEYKTITVPGDTTGTWNTNNTTGVSLRINLGGGSSYLNTPNSWTATGAYGATGAVQLVSTLNATFKLTGVQLEKGSTATSFDYRPYGVETTLCYRYYYKSTQLSTYSPVGVGRAYSSTNGNAPFYLPVPMRANQTITYSSLSHFDIVTAGVPTAIQNDGAGLNNVKIGWAKSSGISAGSLYQFEFSNQTTGWLAFDAEL